MPIPRILEPEVMDTKEEADSYDAMDHSDVNRVFVDDFLSFFSANHCVTDTVSHSANASSTILDVGTGTALIPIELCQRSQTWNVLGVDLAEEMIAKANENVLAQQLQNQIRLQCVDAKQLPFDDNHFQAIISNSIIHHIPTPENCFAEMVRVVAKNGTLFVRDLLRPETNEEVEQLVALYAADAEPFQQQLFRQSLQAALTIAEVQAILETLGLPPNWVAQTTDRHWTIKGIFE